MADIVCPMVRADVTCYWKDMWRRLDAMRRLWQLCDVRLKTDDGSSFMAHSPVLAASSDVLHHMLVATRQETFVDGPGIVPVRNVTPDVLRITLDFIYGVTPTSRADFERLRVGAARLGIEGAYEYCCRRLGENMSGFQHMTDVSVLPPGPAAVTAETTADVEPSCTTVLDDLTSSAEEMSTGDENSTNQTTKSDAAVAMSEIPESVNATVPSNDVPHAAMMAHMSLSDLARADECPHLRQLASEILPTPILEAECLVAESNGSLDDDCSDFLDSVPLKKRIKDNNLSNNQGSSLQEEVNRLYRNDTAGNEYAPRTVAVNHTTPSSSCDLPAVSQPAAAMTSCAKALDRYPQTILTDSITAGNLRSSVNKTSSVNVAACMDFNSPLYATADFSAFSMATNLAPDACISYINDCYPATCPSSSWPSDQHLGMALTTNLSSATSTTCGPPFVIDSFESVLSTANIMRTNDVTVDSVHSSSADVINASANILNGCPQDMKLNFADFGVSLNHWSNSTGNVDGLPQASINGICPVASMPAENNVMYFCPSSVASTVPQFVPPAVTMNSLSSSSSVAPASVAAAGNIAADLSFISLDDVSAVLKANGFSDKMSSPSVSDVSPEISTTDSHICDNHASQCHSSDVNTADTRTPVNVTPSSVARVCIFCEKPCKSER